MSLFSRVVRSRILFALALVLPLGLVAPAFDAEAKKFRGSSSGSKKWGSSKSKAKAKDKKADDDADSSSFPKVKWRGGRDDESSDDDNSQAAAPASSSAKKAKQSELPPAPEDYYTKRAKALLAADRAIQDSKPHPLAKGFPDKFVVVCEGGCPNRKRAQIIDMQPRPVTKVEVESTMVPTAGSTGGSKAAALQDGLVCMAGCYNGMKKSYTGRAAAGAGAGAEYEDTWLTTVSESTDGTAPSSSNKPESGSWLSDIDRARETGAGETAETTTAFSAEESSPAVAAAAPKKIAAVTPTESATGAETPAVDAGTKPVADTQTSTQTTSDAIESAKTPASTDTPPVVVEAKDINTPTPAPAAPSMTVVNAKAAETSGSDDTSKPEDMSGVADATAVTSTPETKDAPEAAKIPVAEDTSVAVKSADTKDKATAKSSETQRSVAVTGPATAESPAPAAPAKETEQKDAPENAQKIAAVSSEPEKSKITEAPKSADQAVFVSSSDPEMNAAIKKARASLDSFWTKLANSAAGETDFSLKVAIKDGKKVEHFWVIGVKRDGDKISGTINNEPELVKNVAFGEHYEFTEDVISDWLYRRNGKMVGNETMRPLLKRMPEDAAAPYWAMYEKQ